MSAPSQYLADLVTLGTFSRDGKYNILSIIYFMYWMMATKTLNTVVVKLYRRGATFPFDGAEPSTREAAPRSGLIPLGPESCMYWRNNFLGHPQNRER